MPAPGRHLSARRRKYGRVFRRGGGVRSQGGGRRKTRRGGASFEDRQRSERRHPAGETSPYFRRGALSTTFVIVQHGEKDQRPCDPGLTVVGQRQAAAAAHVLGSLRPVAVYSSPLLRALETAARIASELGLTVVEDPALTERMNWSADSGASFEDFLVEWQAATRDRTYQPRRGDSSAEAGARFERALLRYAERHRAGTVICVAHGGVTTDLLRNLVGDERVRSLAPDVIERGVPGGALTTVRREANDWHVVSAAVIDHVAEADRTGHRAD